MKTFIIALIIIILIGGGLYYLNQGGDNAVNPNLQNVTATSSDSIGTATSTTPENKTETVLGTSAGGKTITAYHFGEGEKEVLFVGGIHGGYEWNTALVAYELMDYLRASTSTIPAGVKVTVIPVLNPDGLAKVVSIEGEFTASDVKKPAGAEVGLGRFNANGVDLNRNFDCDWKAEGKWQDKTVSGGTSAFSEPESQAVRNYVESANPAAVVVYYSAAGGVYASNCHGEVLAETQTLTDVYARASGYPAYKSFNFYEITGDMVNWLAKMEIPAISVLLTNHTDTEWTKNMKGIDAVLKSIAE